MTRAVLFRQGGSETCQIVFIPSRNSTKNGRGAECQDRQAEQTRNQAYARLVTAFDDLLNRPCGFRTGNFSDL